MLKTVYETGRSTFTP